MLDKQYELVGSCGIDCPTLVHESSESEIWTFGDSETIEIVLQFYDAMQRSQRLRGFGDFLHHRKCTVVDCRRSKDAWI